MGHTPGPWTVGGESDNDGEAEVIVAGDRIIAWTAATYSDDDEAEVITTEDRANARLIAAAADLLEALRALLDRVVENGGFGSIVEAAGEAIAKAEGRSE